jgi:hypothetical protein
VSTSTVMSRARYLNEHRSRAERRVARIEARQLAEGKTEAESERAAGKPLCPPPNRKVVAMPPPATQPPPASGGRLGLADLKRAAQSAAGARRRRVADGAVHLVANGQSISADA